MVRPKPDQPDRLLRPWMRVNFKVAMIFMCLDAKTLLVNAWMKKTLVKNKITMILKCLGLQLKIEDEREGSSHISLLGGTCTADLCIRRSRVTGGVRRRRQMEVRKPKTYINCSV